VTGAFEASDELIALSHGRPEIVHTIAEALRVQLLIKQNWLDEAELWVRSHGYSYESDPSAIPVEHAVVLARLWYSRKQLVFLPILD
jgi:hypothetical protein